MIWKLRELVTTLAIASVAMAATVYVLQTIGAL